MKIKWDTLNKQDKTKFPLRNEDKARDIPIIFHENLIYGEALTNLQQHISKIKVVAIKKGFTDKERFNRAYWENEPKLEQFQNDLLKIAEKHFKTELEKTYHYLSMYFKGGHCPVHTDREECEYTIALNIQQNSIWPFYVEGQQFDLNPGDALFYSGKHHIHWREKASDFCLVDMLLLFYKEKN